MSADPRADAAAGSRVRPGVHSAGDDSGLPGVRDVVRTRVRHGRHHVRFSRLAARVIRSPPQRRRGAPPMWPRGRGANLVGSCLRPPTPAAPDPTEELGELLRDLHSDGAGLSSREAARRLEQHGPNELRRRGGPAWPRQLAAQLTHPLALLLFAAAALAAIGGLVELAIAILVVIALNAAFAFAQERHAERAVEALQAYLPPHARVVRDGREQDVDAAALVPGDLLVVQEGDRICADARLARGRGRGGPVGAQRGVRPRPPRGGSRRRSRRAARRARSRLQRHELHRRRRPRDRHRDRHGDPAGPHRRALAAHRRRRQPAADRGPPRREAHRADRRGRRGGVRPDRRARRAVALGRGRLRDRAARRERAGGSAADDHARARGRRPSPRARGRAREASERGRDPRGDQRHLHGQDRHTHGEPHGGRPCVGRWRRARRP